MKHTPAHGYKEVKDIVVQEGEVLGAMIQYNLLGKSILKTLETGMDQISAVT